MIPYVVVSKKRCSYSILFELLPFIRPCRTIRSLVHRVLIVTLRKEFVTIHSPPLSSKTLLVSKIKQPIRKIGDRGRYISSLNSSYGEISPFRRGPADDPSPHPEDKLTNFSPRISRRSSIRVSYDFQPREEWLIVPIVSSPRLSPTSDRLIILSPPSPLRGDAKSGVEIATNYPPPLILTFVNRCPCLPSFIELKSNIHPGYYFVKPSRPWWINFNCSRSAQWKEGRKGWPGRTKEEASLFYRAALRLNSPRFPALMPTDLFPLLHLIITRFLPPVSKQPASFQLVYNIV